MTWVVTYTKSAAQHLRKMPRNQANKIMGKIDELAKLPNPCACNNVKRLTGWDHAFRLRIGDYRAVFTLTFGQVQVMGVEEIDTRGNIYR